MNSLLLLAILATSTITLCSATPPAEELSTNSIYQYFAPSEASKDRGNLGMYLWIPPNTLRICGRGLSGRILP